MEKYKYDTSIGHRRLVLRRMYHWLAGSPEDYLYGYLKFSQQKPIMATLGGHYPPDYFSANTEYLKEGIRLTDEIS